jgi:exodeoxyribonuclease VII large subunit
MAVPVKSEIINYILDLKKRTFGATSRHINNLENILKARAQGLISPKQMLANIAQRLDDITERLNNGMGFIIRSIDSQVSTIKGSHSVMLNNLIKHKQRDVESLKALMESYNYKNVMKRGFAIVKMGQELVKSAAALNPGDAIKIEFYDGQKNAIIEAGGTEVPAKKASKENTAKIKNPKNENQGDLF